MSTQKAGARLGAERRNLAFPHLLSHAQPVTHYLWTPPVQAQVDPTPTAHLKGADRRMRAYDLISLVGALVLLASPRPAGAEVTQDRCKFKPGLLAVQLVAAQLTLKF